MPEYAFKMQSLPLIGDSSINAQGNHDICCKSPLRNPFSTGSRSFTRPSPSVNALAGRELKRLYLGENIIHRLLAYTDENYHPPIQGPIHRASNCPGSKDLPPKTQVVEALAAIYRKEQDLRNHQPEPLINNQSAQDEAYFQIFQLLNLCLKVKEVNTARKLPAVINETDYIRNLFHDSKGNAVTADRITSLVFTPFWGRSSSIHLKTGIPAGFSDFTLFRSPSGRNGDQPASAEIKDPWNYPTPKIFEIYQGNYKILDEHNLFRHQKLFQGSIPNSLLRQIVGEVNALSSHIGFFSNLDVLFIYLPFEGSDSIVEAALKRTGPKSKKGLEGINLEEYIQAVGVSDEDDEDDEDISLEPIKGEDARKQVEKSSRVTRSQSVTFDIPKPAPEDVKKQTKSGLILSPLMKFEDPRLLKTLQALTYLAIDGDKWNQSLVSILAPIHEITLITQNNQ